MQPIQSLVDEASRLSKSFHSWNNAYMYCVCASAIAVAVTFIVQWKAKTEAESLETANNAVIRAKDELLKEELSHRDERIAKVKADADVSIAQVKAEADEKIAAANRLAEQIGIDSNRKTEELRKQNLATEASLLSAQQDLEKEKLTRLEMEESIGPRWLLAHVEGNVVVGLEKLRPFKGTDVIIEAMPDAEPTTAGMQLASILQSAGWNVKAMIRSFDMDAQLISDGVSICPAFRTLGDATPAQRSAWSKRQQAAQALSEYLTDHKWASRIRPGPPDPPDTITIKIGVKPNPYFLPEPLKTLEKEQKRREEESEERFRKHKEELDKKNEQFLREYDKKVPKQE